MSNPYRESNSEQVDIGIVYVNFIVDIGSKHKDYKVIMFGGYIYNNLYVAGSSFMYKELFKKFLPGDFIRIDRKNFCSKNSLIGYSLQEESYLTAKDAKLQPLIKYENGDIIIK